ncbi:zinc metallochaperone AztD [Microbacterium sp. Clip185]|uniref:zinc metallochaperone AztD n=1 Tax=Microbacterium sp. Clip185 TaxID=3025663 RepID=UPI002366ABF3|nr:zinc metallochaperone AztD [Microbacterium sp. Clip185]WDG17967.1 zinc metallochaperone AztD [Microbacterium sp. Clip185]
MHLKRPALLTLALVAAATLTACAGTAPAPASSSSAAAPAGERVAISYEGGILVLDGTTLETVGDLASEEFTRLNRAGDGSHVLVTMSEGFQILDTGAASGSDPALTDLVFPAEAPGHVVRHAGKTVLYADGTSDTTIVDTDAFASLGDALPASTTIPGTEAHHGVSIVLEDGTFVTTVGSANGRTGITVRDEDGTEITSNADCPGVHGEGTAADEVVVFGCENGALIYRDGEIEKVTAPDAYGRTGNIFVTDTSPLVVGDYKNDPDAEGYLLSNIALIDTEKASMKVVPLPEGVSYTFRDLARGPKDLGYILATDGSIHVIDPASGDLVDEFPVIAPWEGPLEWQDPHPAIVVSGDIAYVTEPAAKKVHAVDLTTGEVRASTTLAVTPNEVAVS